MARVHPVAGTTRILARHTTWACVAAVALAGARCATTQEGATCADLAREHAELEQRADPAAPQWLLSAAATGLGLVMLSASRQPALRAFGGAVAGAGVGTGAGTAISMRLAGSELPDAQRRLAKGNCPRGPADRRRVVDPWTDESAPTARVEVLPLRGGAEETRQGTPIVQQLALPGDAAAVEEAPELWRVRGGRAVSRAGDRLVVDDGAAGVVRAVSARTGRELWRRELIGWQLGGPVAPPVMLGDELVVVAREGVVLALDQASGEERWRLLSPEISHLGAHARQIRAWVGDVLLVTRQDSMPGRAKRKLVRLRGTDGEIIWRRSCGQSCAPVVLGAESVHVETDYGMVEELVREDGHIASAWGTRAPGRFVGAVGNTLIVRRGNQYHGHDLLNGTWLWSRVLEDDERIALGDRQILVSGGGLLRMVEPRTGMEIWAIEIARDGSEMGFALESTYQRDYEEPHLALVRFDDGTRLLAEIDLAAGRIVSLKRAPASARRVLSGDGAMVVVTGSEGWVALEP